MNKAFLVVFIPAIITSFLWLAFGWGWRLAATVTGAEVAVGIAAVIYLLKRQSGRRGGPEGSR
jgi:hypothetical protein